MVEKGSQAKRDFRKEPYSGPELANIRRRTMHLSQGDVAKRLGFRRDILSLIETGIVLPVGEDILSFNERYMSAIHGLALERAESIGDVSVPLNQGVSQTLPEDRPIE